MKLRRKAVWRFFLLGALLLVAAGLVLPRLDADRFGNRVRHSLEEVLGRTVEIGKVRLELFSGPGFSVDRVVIRDDPRAGIEPFAYMESLEARVSFKSFWTGRLEFSNLRLVNPSVNLVRPDAGEWNFVGLLTRTAGADAAGLRLPEIQVRGGRINFKFGDTKSIYYLRQASLDASPPQSPGGEWRMRFQGQPARTDRRALGFGDFSARGQWRPDPRTGGQLNMELELARSPLAELIRLVHGHDIGVHGRAASLARLSGPVSDIHVEGWLELSNLHRWDLLPPHSEGWRLQYQGRLDLVEQTLALQTAPVAGSDTDATVRFRASGYLSRPRWGATMAFSRLPLSALPELARHMGLSLPPALALEGDAAGAIGYSAESGLQGKLLSRGGTARIDGAPPLRFDRAEILIDRSRVRVHPAVFSISGTRGRAGLDLEYSWETGALAAAVTTASIPVSVLRHAALRPLAVPVLKEVQEGAWRGQLRYRHQGDAPGRWSGAFHIENARTRVPGLAAPVEIVLARVDLRESGLTTVDRIQGRADEVEFGGEYHYRPSAARPHHLKLSIPSLQAAELERLFLPALQRGDTLFARALRLGRRQRLPEWLRTRHAEGSFEIGSLDFGDWRFEELRGRFRWDAASFEATEIAGRLGGGPIAGRVLADLGRGLPLYSVSAGFRELDWMGGEWSGEGVIETSGTGPDLLRNLRLESSFVARSVRPSPDTRFEAVSGDCILTLARGVPRLRFPRLVATFADDVYHGQGATAGDGKLLFEFANTQKQLRLGGTLLPLHLDLVPGEDLHTAPAPHHDRP